MGKLWLTLLDAHHMAAPLHRNAWRAKFLQHLSGARIYSEINSQISTLRNSSHCKRCCSSTSHADSGVCQNRLSSASGAQSWRSPADASQLLAGACPDNLMVHGVSPGLL